MKSRWIVVALAALVVGASPALARGKHRPPPQCVDRPYEFSWYNFLPGFGAEPGPNGCAPPVFVGRDFIGQDPDPNIRQQLRRDPGTGNPNLIED
jgi:hypothetical protein